MDEFLKSLELSGEGLTRGFTIQEFLLGLVLSALLSMVISWVYRSTHAGVSYQKGFVYSIIIMAITVSFIMLIIGSNLARAFSLVGALSIVRYRNAIKDTQDISFIFVALAIGMACGTKLYLMAILFTVFASVVMLSLTRYKIATNDLERKIISLGFDKEKISIDECEKILKSAPKLAFSKVSTESLGQKTQANYEIEVPSNFDINELFVKLRDVSPNLDVRIVHGYDNFEL